MTLAGHIRAESARLAALCTACGACVRACPTGAAIRVAPEQLLTVSRLETQDR